MLGLTVGAAVSGISAPANAVLQCTAFNYQGIRQCDAGIRSSVANVFALNQRSTNWCWAACLEMVFRYNGYYVQQSRIVRETYGNIYDWPAQPQTILRQINRQWNDDNGRRFYVSGNSYSANEITAAQDLSNNYPLIIGTLGHAMLLTNLTYLVDVYGRGIVQRAVVRDPWMNRGRRVLSAQEWYSTSFLARVRVQR